MGKKKRGKKTRTPSPKGICGTCDGGKTEKGKTGEIGSTDSEKKTSSMVIIGRKGRGKKTGLNSTTKKGIG